MMQYLLQSVQSLRKTWLQVFLLNATLVIWISIFCWPVVIQWYQVSQFSSVQFSRSVVSDSLQPHESQHARPLCPSPTPGVHSDSCPSSRWCHPTISSSVVPFSSCPQSLPASGSFPMSQFFTSGGQSIGVSTSASVLPMNIQDWSPLGWTGWISLQSKGLSRVFSNTTVQKHQFFGAQLSLQSTSHIHTRPLEKRVCLESVYSYSLNTHWWLLCTIPCAACPNDRDE